MVEDVVREVWRLFRARFWRTLIIVALLLAPLELGVEIVDPDLSSDDWWLWVGISASLIVIAFPWVIGAVIHDVAVEDRTPTDAYRKTAPRLPDLMISALVTTVGIILGTIALVVPGVLLMARWALVVPLIVVEGAPWREALGRSNELVRGRTWSVVLIFVLLTLIGAALVATPLLLGYFVLEGIIGAWLATLAIDTVSVAFFSFAPFVLYRRLTP
ncbi:MAG TPA: glycerophosphoryl diester phosphodiesterase membrane domain-containing protein [Gaiellaceae bacterium]|nr:glycerophosphoryl diester phosphodiesterase membrane domain-containing protein [Gaiellaceae bacterium]